MARFKILSFHSITISMGLLSLAAVPALRGQQASAPPKAPPDVLIFNDGEKLVGHLERSTGSSVVFKSDMAGEITADWSKIKELHTNDKFAVIGKNVKLHRHASTAQVPQGTIAMTDQNIQVTPSPQAAPQTIPVPNTAYVVDQATFEKNILSTPGFFQDWTGNLTAALSLVQATQNSRSFTGAASFVRTVPNVNWLNPSYRTIIDFTQTYGSVSQPKTPTVKTNILHADIEQDKYVSPKLFLFVKGAWDHNYSQALDLQQTYGAGVGYTLIKDAVQQLDLTASIDYIRQSFFNPAFNKNLIGSTFGENYNRKFPKSIVLTEGIAYTIGWNDTSAYTTVGNLTLSFPLYKKFNLTLGVLDSYLNNPPPTVIGVKKNSFQFTTGVTYTVP